MADYVPYYEKLRDPRWQKRRLEIMQRDNFKCVDCGNGESTLNVHHTYYLKATDPWDYDNHCLKTLCEPCHNHRHDQMEQLGRALSMMGVTHLAAVAGFAKQLYFITGGKSERFDGYRADPTLSALHSLYSESQCQGAMMAACGGLEDFNAFFSNDDLHASSHPGAMMDARKRYVESKIRDEIAAYT